MSTFCLSFLGRYRCNGNGWSQNVFPFCITMKMSHVSATIAKSALH